MTNWLMGTAAILAFVCSTVVLTPAFAQDEGGGEDVGGEVVIDDGVLNDGDIPVEGGEVVPYGPEDCVECNGAPVTADGGGRPEGENYRGDIPNESFARTGSDSSDEICDHTKMGKAATVCE